MPAMKVILSIGFLLTVLAGEAQTVMPLVGVNVRNYYNTKNLIHYVAEATSRVGATIGAMIRLKGDGQPLFMASLNYAGGSIKQENSGFAGYDTKTASYSYLQLGLAAYLFNGQYKSWSGGIGLEGGVVLYEKSKGWHEMIIIGQDQKKEDIHISYPAVVNKFKIGPSVYVKKTIQLGDKHAIEPFLYSTLYLSDEVKYSNVKAMSVGLGIIWVIRKNT